MPSAPSDPTQVLLPRQTPQQTQGVRFARELGAFGARPAVATHDETLTYAALAQRVDEVGDRLGATRRLVLLAGTNELDTVVTYLAALAGGHPVILVPGDHPGHLAAVQEAYDPDVVVTGGELHELRPGTAHDLHPDLALLLSTSGSTGSPKLVRLSAGNIEANAASIASYLAIRPTDIAATTLPLHYCYGLSVLNSHLHSGASLMLTSLSVVDACFWDRFRAVGATTFAAVPYTFDLLDRVGFEQMDLPSLRYLTQAGGRLAPQTVRRFAELGRRSGWDLFVMYGQTEATARMAYLPPDLALTSPGSIGVPVPGGSFRLEPLPERPLDAGPDVEVGELVYDGPNVMMGYAETPADLALGSLVGSLHTGDVARRTPDGLYEIVGRRTRFAKVFGLRIDLDEVERVYAAEGILAACASAPAGTSPAATGDRLVVAVAEEAAPVDVARVEAVAKEHLGLPPGAVAVRPVPQVPRLPNGKPDYRAVAALTPPTRSSAVPATGSTVERLLRVYAAVLHREDVGPEDTFVSLEGDSLSYVEMSIRVEEVLGRLPAGWHVMPVAELASHAGAPARGRTVEANVLLRALAILAIVGSHANVFVVLGGAHVLLASAGFNLGRFHLTDASRTDRVRHLLSSVTRVAVPSAIWIGLVSVFTDGLDWKNALLLNGVLGPAEWTEPAWHYWFIEALVYTLLAVTALVALPIVDRAERRWPFWLPVALAGLGLLTRYDLVSFAGGDEIHRAHAVFWLFALGWATVKATRPGHRLLVSALTVATVPGFFDDPVREAVVVAGVLVLVWVRSVRLPAWVAHAVGVLASASLYIYLVHWQVYPSLEERLPVLATVLSLLAGIALWRCVERATCRLLPGR